MQFSLGTFLEMYGGLLFAKVFLLMAIYYIGKAYAFKKNAVRVPGKYLFNGSYMISGGATMYYPVFEYVDPVSNEKKHVSSTVRTGWPRESYKNGVTILVHKKTSVARVCSFAEFHLATTALMLVSFFILSFHYLV